MTKFKLRGIAMAGVMAMGLSLIPTISVDAACDALNNAKVVWDDEYIETSKKVFYTIDGVKAGTGKNAGKYTITPNKWILADDKVIDFSGFTKETVVYVCENPYDFGTKVDEAVFKEKAAKITIPAQSKLSIKVNSNLADGKLATADKLFTFSLTIGKNKDPLSDMTDIDVKTTASSKWTDFSTFFTANKVANLSRKGTTLYFRYLPTASVQLASDDNFEYTIKDDEGTQLKRASKEITGKVKALTAAPNVKFNSTKATVNTSVKMEFAVVKEGELTEFDSNIAAWADCTASMNVSTSQNLLDAKDDAGIGDEDYYMAVRTKSTAKAPASSVIFVKIPNQITLQQEQLKGDLKVEKLTKDESKSLKAGTVKISYNNTGNGIYQYALATSAEAATSWVDIKTSFTNGKTLNIAPAKFTNKKKETLYLYVRQKATETDLATTPLVIDFTEDGSSIVNKDTGVRVIRLGNDVKIKDGEAKVVVYLTSSAADENVDVSKVKFNSVAFTSKPVADSNSITVSEASVNNDEVTLTITATGSYDINELIGFKVTLEKGFVTIDDNESPESAAYTRQGEQIIKGDSEEVPEE